MQNIEAAIRHAIFALLAVLMACSSTFADEGMWLYSSFPKDKVSAKYGFQ
jgi:hypothetical protein